MRTALLKSLKNLITITPSSVVNNSIFDPMLSGFADSNVEMRQNTLFSLAHVVDKLDEKQMQDKLVRCITNLQSDGEASIRTNATIFLGRIASKLKEGVRVRIICPAIAKAMRDPFVHCRLAGLKAAVACISLLDVVQLTGKVMPQACVLLVDRSSEVRELSLTLLDAGAALLKQHHAKLVQLEKSAASQNIGSQSQSDGGSESPSRPTGGGGGGGASWTSWVSDGLSKSIEIAASSTSSSSSSSSSSISSNSSSSKAFSEAGGSKQGGALSVAGSSSLGSSGSKKNTSSIASSSTDSLSISRESSFVATNLSSNANDEDSGWGNDEWGGNEGGGGGGWGGDDDLDLDDLDIAAEEQSHGSNSSKKAGTGAGTLGSLKLAAPTLSVASSGWDDDFDLEGSFDNIAPKQTSLLVEKEKQTTIVGGLGSTSSSSKSNASSTRQGVAVAASLVPAPAPPVPTAVDASPSQVKKKTTAATPVVVVTAAAAMKPKAKPTIAAKKLVIGKDEATGGWEDF